MTEVRYETPLAALREPLRKFWATSMAMYPNAGSSRPSPEHHEHAIAKRDLHRAIAQLLHDEENMLDRRAYWMRIVACEWENGSLLMAPEPEVKHG